MNKRQHKKQIKQSEILRCFDYTFSNYTEMKYFYRHHRHIRNVRKNNNKRFKTWTKFFFKEYHSCQNKHRKPEIDISPCDFI